MVYKWGGKLTNNIPDYSASQEADNSVRVDSSQTSSKLDAKIGKICRAGFICSVAASIITLSVIVFSRSVSTMGVCLVIGQLLP